MRIDVALAPLREFGNLQAPWNASLPAMPTVYVVPLAQELPAFCDCAHLVRVYPLHVARRSIALTHRVSAAEFNFSRAIIPSLELRSVKYVGTAVHPVGWHRTRSTSFKSTS